MRNGIRNYTPGNLAQARHLRRVMTRSEKRLWYDGLRDEQLGYHFRRQHPVDSYILDFYCAEALLCVEVDGSGHEWSVCQDAQRDETLLAHGILTLRFASDNVHLSLGEVLYKIKEICDERSDLPLPQGEGDRRQL